MTIYRPVFQFRNTEAFLRMRDGREILLNARECTFVLLTSDLFPSGDKAAASVYLTRQGLDAANRCGAGSWLLLRTQTVPSGRGRVTVHARRLEIYSKITV